jgi:hypothetical protein
MPGIVWKSLFWSSQRNSQHPKKPSIRFRESNSIANDDPFEPAVPVEDWEAISAIMTEWNSEADELAYRNL